MIDKNILLTFNSPSFCSNYINYNTWCKKKHSSSLMILTKIDMNKITNLQISLAVWSFIVDSHYDSTKTHHRYSFIPIDISLLIFGKSQVLFSIHKYHQLTQLSHYLFLYLLIWIRKMFYCLLISWKVTKKCHIIIWIYRNYISIGIASC